MVDPGPQVPTANGQTRCRHHCLRPYIRSIFAIMSEIRHRGSVRADSTKHQAVVDSASADSSSSPRTRNTTRLLKLCFSFTFASALFLVFRSSQSSILPASYALCSREGNIYTVNEEKPKVECCVVHNGRIADTGSICILLCSRSGIYYLKHIASRSDNTMGWPKVDRASRWSSQPKREGGTAVSFCQARFNRHPRFGRCSWGVVAILSVI